MAQQQDKERERAQGTPQGASTDAITGHEVPVDPDVYDPVGMAGKKAGIVTEIEQDQKGSTPKEEKSKPVEKRNGGTTGK